jgi:hypothetical protein
MALVKYNNNSISAVSSLASLPSGALVPIKTLTASSSSTLSFVDGSDGVVLDNTYPIYVFKFINCHPQTEGKEFGFNLSVDSGSNYNVAKTSTFFLAYNYESGGSAGLSYHGGGDLAQGTGLQQLATDQGADSDASLSGTLHLFNPSSTTFVKHFIATTNELYLSGAVNSRSNANYIAGYGNTTSAVDAIQFKMNSGNIDSGTIKLYGIKDS